MRLYQTKKGKKEMWKLAVIGGAFLILTISLPAFASEEEHGHEEEEGSAIELSLEQQIEAKIVVDQVKERKLSESVRLPGEVIANAYRSSSVTPRISAQIVSRHVKLGDEVAQLQRLVTLSSVVMAEAQGELIVADKEWQRVNKLGEQTVGEKRYTQAQVDRQQSLAKVIAYGMSTEQATALLKQGDASLATGEFDLLSPQDGTVLSDEFVLGEFIHPGRTLIEITDESSKWVNAQAVPSLLPHVESGTPARIDVDGRWLRGKVIQLHHRLDEETRTQAIRIEVDNSGDLIHAGQFVEVEISVGDGEAVMAVPNSAVTMIEGQPNVFLREEGHEFHPTQIEVEATIGEWTVTDHGISLGDEVAVEGVFYLKSLLLKSSLGEGHAH